MKSALKKSVVSTSISLILASGMAAFAAHAADDVKLKATKTNVAFSDFTPTEYSTKGKPNIIVLTMGDLGYGQLPFDKGSFDPKTMENREVVDTYKIGIDKAIEAAQKSTPTLLSFMVLDLIRQSAPFRKQTSLNGFYQDNGGDADLLRLNLSLDSQLYPQISGHKSRFAIRFMPLDSENGQVPERLDFELACC